MATLKEFVKDKEFGKACERKAESFPEGTTKIDASKTEVAELQVKFDDVEKTRYVLKIDGKEYWAGTQIMEGVKAAQEAGFDSVAITRKGEGIHTKYTVMGVPDKEKEKDDGEQAL